MHQDVFGNLLDNLYHSVLDQAHLKEFLQALAAAMDADTALLRLVDIDSNQIFFFEHHNYHPELAKEYASYYIKLDLFTQYARNIPTGAVVRSQEIIPDCELVKTELYNDYMRRLGSFHLVGACALRNGGRSALISTFRDKKAGAFTDGESGVLRQLMPHLNCALTISQRMEQLSSQHQMLSHEMDQTPIGMIFFDATGSIIDLNARASAIIDEHPLLYIRHRKLSSQQLDLRKKIELMVQTIVAFTQQGTLTPSADTAVRVPGADKAREIHILASPLGKQVPQHLNIDTQKCYGVLILGAPEQRQGIPHAILKALYNLSFAESRLVNLLATGVDLKEASDQLEISPHTARAQLKSVFRKTGVKRQAELIKLVFTSPASLYLKRNKS